jgi:single-strand DNA-binding protein
LVVFNPAAHSVTLQFPGLGRRANRISKEETMNSVHLIGRLATDVDVKEVNGGSKVSTFILAVDRNAEEADFFRIKAWNSQAEAAGDHLGKGRRIAVEGSLRQDVYEKDGEERKAVSVVAKRLEYL